MQELKPCPFCGSNRGVYYLYGTNSSKWGAAQCLDCGAIAPEVRTHYDDSDDADWHKEANDEWNRRAKEEKPAAEVPPVAPTGHIAIG